MQIASVQHHGTEQMDLHLYFNSMTRAVSGLADTNMLLASQAVFLMGFQKLSATEQVAAPPVGIADSSCCSWSQAVESVATSLFSYRPVRPLRVVELGVHKGETGLYLLSRFQWIHYLGVDTLAKVVSDGNQYGLRDEVFQADLRTRFGAFGQRARLLVPMTTDEAASLMQEQNASADLVIVDAQFTPEGFMNDLETWAPLVNPGGCIIARYGFELVLRRFSNNATIRGRRPGEILIGSAQDGIAYHFSMS